MKNMWEYSKDELKKLTDLEFIKILNKMSLEIYNKNYYSMFDIDFNNDMMKNYDVLLAKYHVQHPDTVLQEGASGQRNFLDIWREIWNKRITQQSEVCELYALCAMSQIFNKISLSRGNVVDDLRIHLCIIAPTATGKSEGNNMLIEFCNNTEFNYSVIGEFSPATLVGTVNKSTVDANNIMKAWEGDDDWRDPSQVGMLGNSDYIMFDEGEAILHTTSRTEGSQQILQKAMNRYGSAANLVSNTLVNGKVEYHPNCNIIITSFYQNHFKESLLDRGMLQRMIIYFREESDVDRVGISDFIYDGMEEIKENETSEDLFNRIKNNKIKENQLFAELKNETNKLRMRHIDTEYVILDVGATTRFKEQTKELRMAIPTMTPYQNVIWETLISRITPTFMKVAAIYALMDYRDKITPNDVDKAAAILQKTMQSIAIFMIGKISSDKTTDTHMPIYKKLRRMYRYKKLDEAEWINIIIIITGVSVSSAKRSVEDLKAGSKLMPRLDINTGEKKLELV